MALQLLIMVLTPYMSSAAISCYGDSGQPVDWFIVYKLPQALDNIPDAGMRYMYQDGDSGGWVPGASLMNSTASAVGRTLDQLYRSSKSQDVAYILYNDQPPKDPLNAAGGHTKGVVLLDRDRGFWLVHSTPRFPYPTSSKYGWPSSAYRNGQSFLCVTYPYKQFNEIGTQLLYNTITPYDSSVPDSFGEDLPDLNSSTTKKNVTLPNWKRIATLTSAGGRKFLSFAKHAKFGDDLYSGWVSEYLKSDLYVQFWNNAQGRLPSNCSLAYHTYNIEALSFGPSANFSSHIDHSKWCVTNSTGWACIGDINRDKAEEKRGGGTVCSQDPTVWKSFITLVQNYTKC